MTIANYNIASSNSDELLGVSYLQYIFKNSFRKLIKKSMSRYLCEYASLIFVNLCGCVITENVIANLTDYKKWFYELYIMLNVLSVAQERQISDNTY